MDSPALAEFVANLEPVNALADFAPGFVWRLEDESGDATSIRAFDDERLIINMSVWESIESLGDYVYRTDHAGYLRRRREWFERMRDVIVALWWIPAGSFPTVTEGIERLEYLRANGPTARSFTFRMPFAPTEENLARDARNECWV